MKRSLIEFMQRWIVTTLAVLVAANIVHGLDYQSVSALLAASLLLGLFNATLKPLLIALSVPLVVFSLGLFIFAIPVINALLLLMAGALVKGFIVRGFWAAFWGSLVISAVSIVTNAILGNNARIVIRKGGRGGGRGGDDDRPGPGPGSGPVIDV